MEEIEHAMNSKKEIADWSTIYRYISIKSNIDGSTANTPVILTLSTSVINTDPSLSLFNHKTVWQGFRNYLKTPLQTQEVENACESITRLIQVSVWKKNTISMSLACIITAIQQDLPLISWVIYLNCFLFGIWQKLIKVTR